MDDGQNTIISIDWIKIEEEPNKKYKIQGQFLLDLRAKCEYLKGKLELAEEKSINLNNQNLSITKELEKTQAINKKSIKEKEGIIGDLELQIENLKIKLEKYNNRINELSDLLKEKESRILELSTTSDQKISSVNSELNSAYSKISALEDTVNNIKDEIESRNVELGEFSLVNKELEEVKDKLNLELIEKTKSIANMKSEINTLKKELDEKTKEVDTKTEHLGELERELDELKPPDINSMVFSNETRIVCPSCEAVGKHIEKVDDKKTVLSYIGSIPMYAKKYVCKKCTYEWK